MDLEPCNPLYAEESSQALAPLLTPSPSSVSGQRLAGSSHLGKATSRGVGAPGLAPAPVIAFCCLIPCQLN